MPAFPRHSIAWQLEHKTTLRRFSLSLPLYGVGTGIVSRLYRWSVLSFVGPVEWGGLLLAVAIGVIIICALAAGHLANFPPRHWRWRAPALGAFMAAGEAATSLVLTLVHQERLGRSLATLGDWPSTALTVLVSRVVIVSLFAAVLAVVVLALQKTGMPEN